MGATGRLTQVVARQRDDGMREFLLDPTELKSEEVYLQDYCGRMTKVEVNRTAVLLMVPTGDIGALVFERDPQNPRHPEDNKAIFLQRMVVGRHEVFDMVEKAVADERRLVEFPGSGFGRKM
jgi:hypothetical protein